MNPRWILVALFLATLLCLIAPLYIISARAHTITWPDGETFTFDTWCCNATDCEAVPLTAIKEVKGGYQVDYTTSLGGWTRRIAGFVPHGSPSIRFNPFADRVMACGWSRPGKIPGTFAPRCIYPRLNSM